MKLNFIPFTLNENISEFKGQIQFVETDNGVDLYGAINPLNEFLKGIPGLSINLYFYQDRLITVYLNIDDSLKNQEKVIRIVEQALGRAKIFLNSQFQIKQGWEDDNKVLYIIRDETLKKIYLYYSLREYSVI